MPESHIVEVAPPVLTPGTEPSSVLDWRHFLFSAWQNDLFRKIAQTYATQILNLIAALVTTVMVTRALGPQGRGIYAVAIAVGTLGVQFSNLGLHLSNTYYVAKDRSLLPALLGNTLLMSFGVSGLLAVAAAVFFWITPRNAPVHGLPLSIALAWMPFGLALLLSENLLLGIHEVKIFNVVEGLNKLLGLTLALGLIFAGIHEVEWFLAASFCAMVLSLVVALWSVCRFVKDWPIPSLRLLRKTFGVGWKAYLIVLLSFLVLRIDLLMVKYLRGAEQAGYYSIAASMADVCLMLPMAVASILFPKLSGTADFGHRLALTNKATIGVGAALCCLLAFAGFAATPLVRLVFGVSFLPAASAFVWLIPGILTLGMETILVQFLNSIGFPISVIFAWLITTILNIGSNLWAIPKFGIVGASVVSSATYFLTFLLVLFIMLRTRTELLPAD